jgi:hypothetical protein
MGASPRVIFSASATKGEIQAEVAIEAILVPVSSTTSVASFRPRVVSFVPKLQWIWLEVTKPAFIKAILAVELHKLTDRMPTVDLPVSEKLKLGAPKKTQEMIVVTGNGSTLTMLVTIPSTEKDRVLEILKYVFLPSGIHIFGSVK